MNRRQLKLVQSCIDVRQIVGEVVQGSRRKMAAESVTAKIQTNQMPLARQRIADPIEHMRVVQPPMEEEQVRSRRRASFEGVKWQASGGGLSREIGNLGDRRDGRLPRRFC
jgi:hypothetical protein